MELDANFYHILFNTLQEQITPRYSIAKGWVSSPELTSLVRQLYEEAHARHVFVVEQTGNEIVSYGDLGHINVTDLVALLVNKMLACRALAESLNVSPFTEVSFEGRHWGAHFSFLSAKAILMVVFDDKTNIDLVNLRVRRLARRLAMVLQAISC